MTTRNLPSGHGHASDLCRLEFRFWYQGLGEGPGVLVLGSQPLLGRHVSFAQSLRLRSAQLF